VADWDAVADKQVLITGASGGIGLAAAQEFARRKARLAIVARSAQRGEQAAHSIRAACRQDAHVDVLIADLSSQAAVRRLAEQVLERYPSLQVLINNAGALYRTRQLSEDGIELTWAVNHLAPFLLTNLLADRLKRSAPARVVTTASDAHRGAHIPFDDPDAERSYKAFGLIRYGETKLANILFTIELARRLEGSGVSANCFHPGVVASGFNRNNGVLMKVVMSAVKPFSRSVEKGAETMVWLADSPAVCGHNGDYFEDLHPGKRSREAQDGQIARRLWELSERQTGLVSASVA
jgi:NAD(P)-dependent dehydrogenase (short-subunit alcohol dehydrogenase family)